MCPVSRTHGTLRVKIFPKLRRVWKRNFSTTFNSLVPLALPSLVMCVLLGAEIFVPLPHSHTWLWDFSSALPIWNFLRSVGKLLLPGAEIFLLRLPQRTHESWDRNFGGTIPIWCAYGIGYDMRQVCQVARNSTERNRTYS